jgi:hypothetical protein
MQLVTVFEGFMKNLNFYTYFSTKVPITLKVSSISRSTVDDEGNFWHGPLDDVAT